MRALKFATFLMLLSFISYSQEPNDCINAITICGNGTFTSNASGPGTFQEVAGCGGYENNSVWLKINIINAGTLGFNLIPTNTDLAVDYDFWVYGANMPCNNLGSPIRCCTTNPLAANLSSNVTGMVGTTITTTSGPGDLGNGFVRWINVQPGEFYYIAIDRPEGDGGFQLEWTGTAMNNGGAFPVPPTAASLGEVRSCSNTSNAGIFDLNSIKSQINSDIINNTISFYLNASDATDGTNSLLNIYGNISNPQTIFARVKNIVSGCFTITSFQLKVYEIPNATITTNTPTICSNGTGTIKINGTPNAIIEYNVNGGATQTASLNNLGVLQISSPLTITSTYTLTKVKIVDASNVTLCSQNLNVPVTITITPDNTVTPASIIPVLCINTTLTPFSHTTTGATGIGVPTGLPSGVTASFGSNTITISGIPATSGVFNYTIPLTGGCGAINATGSINVNQDITVASIPIISRLCINSYFSANTHTTTGATGIGVAVGLPTGVTATWALNTITISGTPSASGTFNYSIPLTGYCGFVIATGTMTVYDDNTVSSTSNIPILCVNSVLSPITHTTTGATGIGIPSGLPTGVIASWASNTITISGTPTVSGIFNYTITLTGGCNLINASGTIEVKQNNTVTAASTAPIVCINTPLTAITHTTSGASGIGVASGLPTGVTATWALNTITIIGTPSVSGIFIYTIPLTGGCGIVNAIGTIKVNPLPSSIAISGTTTTCAGIPVNVTVSATPGTQITWNGIPNTFTINASGSNVISVTPTNTTVYQISSAGLNGCIIPVVGQTATVTISTTPQFVTQIPDFEICNDSTLNIASLLTSTVTGANFIWSATTSNVNMAAISGDETNIDQMVTLINSSQNGTINLEVKPQIGSCSGTPQQIIIVVKAIPIITSITFNKTVICDNELVTITSISNPTATLYNWQIDTANGVEIASGITNGTSATGIINLQVQLTNPLVSGTIQFQITPILGTCTGTMQTSTLINVVPYPNLPQTLPIQNACSGTALSLQISDSPHVAGTTLVWEVDQMFNATGATSGSGIAPITISDLLTATNNQAGYVVYKVKSVLATCETDYVYYRVNVNAIPEPILEDGYMCFDADGNIIQSHYLNAGNFTGNYQFFWHKVTTTDDVIGVSSGPIYQVYTPGMYYVVARNIATGCLGTSNTVEVISITSPNDIDYSVTDAFTENAQISITIDGGTGEYLSKLDDGPFQTSLNFTGVSSGLHFISVMNTKGCSLFTKEVNVIGYPKYFTPNGDGIHDTWNIIGMNQPDAKVHIYDRFGKLLKQITPNLSSQGWDGTYFGSLLPSTDYWFAIEYKENNIQKLFKAHFTLKR